MGGLLRNLVRTAVLGWLAAWVVAIVGAVAVKRRTVPADAPEDDEVVLVGIFGPIDHRSTARSFRGGLIECWMGGGVIDLRSATLDPGGADLVVRAIFGGGQLLVPADWTVTSTMRGIGGLVDSRSPDDVAPDGPELRIEATVMFGGFVVASETSEEAAEDRADREDEAPTVDDASAPAVLTV